MAQLNDRERMAYDMARAALLVLVLLMCAASTYA